MKIPDSVTEIGDYAFHQCSGLTSVTIGSGVTSIGMGAFSDCGGLASVTFAVTEGWKVSRYEDMSDATDLQASVLQDTTTAARYLITYTFSSYWKRGE